MHSIKKMLHLHHGFSMWRSPLCAVGIKTIIQTTTATIYQDKTLYKHCILKQRLQLEGT
jgi:hypothetical protein